MARMMFLSYYDEICQGLRYLSAYLKSKGHETCIVSLKRYRKTMASEAPFTPPYGEVNVLLAPEGEQYLGFNFPATDREFQLLFDFVDEWKPDLLGSTLAYCGLRLGIQTTAMLKERYPEVPHVWGGSHPTAVPERCVDLCDWVCVGEGEAMMEEIGRRLDVGNRDFIDVPNVAFRAPDGEVVKNPLAPVLQDMDAYPFPDYDLATNYFIDFDRTEQGDIPKDTQHGNSYVLMSARGCPCTCTFCIHSNLREMYTKQRLVRRRSVDNVIDEIRWAVNRYGPKFYLQIHDEIFTLNKKWVSEFCFKYKQNGFTMPFWCYTHPKFCDVDMIKKLQSVGLRFVIMGIQSGSEELNRDIYQRPTVNAEILEAAWNLHHLGVTTYFDFLTNSPLESDDDLWKTLLLINQLPPSSFSSFGKIIAYPGYIFEKQLMNAGVAYPYRVDEEKYRFWNHLFVLAQRVKMEEHEWRAIVENPFLREHPEIVEKITLGFFKELDDAFRYKTIQHEYAVRVGELEAEMQYIRHRRGLSTFLKASDKLKNLKYGVGA